MRKTLFAFFRTRWDHFKQCWEHAQHHQAVTVITALILAYSVYTEYVERWVEVPQVHIKKLPLSWALAIAFSGLFFIVLEGSYRWRKAVSPSTSADVPQLYLQYEDGYRNDFMNSGFFLRVEGERKASNVEVSSEETVGSHHVRLGMRWFSPGHPIGKDPVAVRVECFYQKDGIPGIYHNRMGDQIYTFFDHKRDDLRELIVTLNYTDVSGRACPARRFRIYQDVPHLTDGKISCEPVKIQAAS